MKEKKCCKIPEWECSPLYLSSLLNLWSWWTESKRWLKFRCALWICIYCDGYNQTHLGLKQNAGFIWTFFIFLRICSNLISAFCIIVKIAVYKNYWFRQRNCKEYTGLYYYNRALWIQPMYDWRIQYDYEYSIKVVK